jgi:hypothetical protein
MRTGASFLAQLVLAACTHGPEFTVNFDVLPSPDGQRVSWILTLSGAQYDAMLDSTPAKADINRDMHSKVRAIVEKGLKTYGLFGCQPRTDNVIKLSDGSFSFVGACVIDQQRAVSARRII